MALDAELLDRFERDWNDAMANYEARTTASRMGNVQYDPASRTFAPQEVDPKVSMGIQNELFGPLQAKWGMLSETGGRRSSVPSMQPQEPRYFQTRAGVFSVDPMTGESENIIPVPESQPYASTARPRTYSAVAGEDMLGRPTRLSMTGDEFRTFMQSAPPELKTNLVNSAINQMLGPGEEAMALPSAATNAPMATPPVASSVKRFKWVQGQLQPQ